MSGRKSSGPTYGMSPAEAASYWYVRRDGRDLSAEEQAEFDDWLRESPDHAEQFARMVDAWNLYDDHESDPGLAAQRRAVLAASPSRRGRIWQAAAGGLIAASLAAGIILLEPAYRTAAPVETASNGGALVAASTDDMVHATRKGELRTVVLADGSKVTLNTDSKVRIAFSAQRRIVKLVQGQVLFEVAHDAARPFVVEAADRHVTALGTVFEVRLEPGRMEVVLVEGKVVVDRRDAANAVHTPTVLRPGQELIVQTGAAPRVVSADLGTKLRWREGFVEFVDEPLGQAVAEINRYTDRPIRMADERLAAQRISGVFRTGDPGRFVAIVGELLPVEARTHSDRIELVSPPARP